MRACANVDCAVRPAVEVAAAPGSQRAPRMSEAHETAHRPSTTSAPGCLAVEAVAGDEDARIPRVA